MQGTVFWILFGHTESTLTMLEPSAAGLPHLLESPSSGLSLQQQVSPRLRSTLHLIATLENSTLRHFDLNLQLQVSRTCF